MQKTKPYTIKLFLMVQLIAITWYCKGQDIHFSQYNRAPLMLNPALAGHGHDLAVHINYKDQWKSINAPYTTYAGAADIRFPVIRKQKGQWIGGIQFFNDRAGDGNMSTTFGDLVIGYQLKLNKKSNLSAALSGGFGQRSISYEKLQWGNQFDGTNFNEQYGSGEPVSGQSRSYGDLGAGLVYVYRLKNQTISSNDQIELYGGIAVDHVTRPSYSFYGTTGEKLYNKWSMFASTKFGITNTNISLQPELFYVQQGTFSELLMGGRVYYSLREDSKVTDEFKHSNIALGVFYRNKDAVIISWTLNWSSYSIGLSYDINVSDLSDATVGKGGLELSLRFRSNAIFRR